MLRILLENGLKENEFTKVLKITILNDIVENRLPRLINPEII